MSLGTLKDKIAKHDGSGCSPFHYPLYGQMMKWRFDQDSHEDGCISKSKSLVGGLVDGTSSTLKIPDHDIAVKWNLDETLTQKMKILSIDEGECGLYHLLIKPGEEEEFKRIFLPFVKDIHGGEEVGNFHKPEDAYLNVEGKTFINANLMRNQFHGFGVLSEVHKLIHSLVSMAKSEDGFNIANMVDNFIGLSQNDTFSSTGSAKTFNVDMSVPSQSSPIDEENPDQELVHFMSTLKVEVDFVNMFVIPYKHLPDDLKIWERRPSSLLTEGTKMLIKRQGATVTAKSLKGEAQSQTTWRVSLNNTPIIEHLVKDRPDIDVKKILMIIKDIKEVYLAKDEQIFLKSYNVRNALLWCLEKNSQQQQHHLLINTLQQISIFLKDRMFPSFLEEKRNLIFNMDSQKCEKGVEKIKEIGENLHEIMKLIEEKQEIKKKENSSFFEKLPLEDFFPSLTSEHKVMLGSVVTAAAAVNTLFKWADAFK